jgi:hypothetical protein
MKADPVRLYMQQMFSDGLFTLAPDQLAELEKKIRQSFEEQQKKEDSA